MKDLTKGNWVKIANQPKVVSQFANGVGVIVEVNNEKMSEAEKNANAKLIAASPKLLEKAINLLSWNGDTPKHCIEELKEVVNDILKK